MKNDYAGHPTFRYDTFLSEVVQIDGLPYVIEQYQCGEIWSEDEVWGTMLIDLTNKRTMDWWTFIDEVKWWKEYIEKYPEKWEEFDKDYECDEDAYEYYMNYYKNDFKADKYNSI